MKLSLIQCAALAALLIHTPAVAGSLSEPVFEPKVTLGGNEPAARWYQRDDNDGPNRRPEPRPDRPEPKPDPDKPTPADPPSDFTSKEDAIEREYGTRNWRDLGKPGRDAVRDFHKGTDSAPGHCSDCDWSGFEAHK